MMKKPCFRVDFLSFTFCFLLLFSSVGGFTVSKEAGLDRFDPKTFESIDNFARSVILLPTDTSRSLALTLTRSARSDVEKARALFVWVTQNIRYDANAFFSGNYGSSSADDVLRSGQSVCQGYANLFEAMGKAAGLEVVTVSGWAKGFGYQSGNTLNSATNHAWNAVRLGGKWYLLDSTWGAGHLSGRDFVKFFEPFFFLTPAEELIYTHFPQDSRWQLLLPVVSREEFLAIPQVWADFFRCGLEFIDAVREPMTAQGELSLRFRVPEDSRLLISLSGPNNQAQSGSIFTQREADVYTVRMNFQQIGSHNLFFFAKKTSDIDNVYHSAFSLTIQSKSVQNPFREFPSTSSLFLEKNVQVEKPLQKLLVAGKYEAFRIKVPNALEVFVLCGEKWNTLTSSGAWWEGTVWIEEGTVVVLAKFPGESTYWHLIEYLGVSGK